MVTLRRDRELIELCDYACARRNMDDQNPTPDQQPTHQQIARIAVKIPPVFKKNIQSWIRQMEAQFHLAGITNEVTRYYHLYAALDQDIAADICDHLDKDLGSTPYSDLKAKLIEQFQQTTQDKIRNLLQDLALGDQKPSQLARKMKQLAPQLPEDFLLQLFKQRLPNWVTAILATVKNPTLEEAANIADKIIENTPNQQIHSTATTPAQPNMQTPSEDPIVAAIKTALAELGIDKRFRPRSRSRRNNSKSRSRSRNADLCWYHNKFGERARKCTQPCSHQGNATAQH